MTKRDGEHIRQVISGLEARVHASGDGGQPLPKAARSLFEPRFGYDFSQVQVHTDSSATDAAQGLKAKAYTAGRDIVFRNITGTCLCHLLFPLSAGDR